MTAKKIRPERKSSRYEKKNCSGKLRVEVKVDEGEISEIILMPKKGGCKYNLQLIGRLLTSMIECNIDINYIITQLEDTDPCPAPLQRWKRENGGKEEYGLGGCPKIILGAIKQKLGEINGR